MKLDLDRYVPGLLLWVSNRLTSSASQLYRSRFDLGVTDWRVLAYFQVYPWSTATAACDLMGLDKAAVSRSLAVLLAARYLDSRPRGQRMVEYATSSAGSVLHDEMVVLASAREEALLAGFSKAERAALVDFLHRMLANMPAVSEVGISADDAQ
jgi:DNA-binding MarR family transcriptional regulator